MTSTRFESVADNHYRFLLDPPETNWSAAKVNQYTVPPRNYVTPDEAAAIIALGGQIRPAWYDTQHAIPVAGADMAPDPDWVAP